MGYRSYDPVRGRRKKTKTRIIVCLVILAVIIAAAVGGGVIYSRQKSNLEALRYASNYTSDEIQQKIQDNNNETARKVIEITGTEMRDLTQEETAMLESGEISENEAAALVTGETTLDEILSGEYEAEPESEGAAGQPENPAGGSESSASDSSQSAQESADKPSGASSSSSGKQGGSQADVSATIAKVYVLKSEFTSSVDSLVSQAKSDYAGGMSTPDLMRKYSGLAASLEGSCDSRMESLLSELDAKLDASGGDKSVINEIRSSYESEKSLKKAELLSKYKN